MSEKNTAGLIEDVVAFILSGDRRTTAQNLRTLLFNYLDSMPNNIDAGTIFQNELGYKDMFRPTAANAFATVDMIKGASSDNPLTELYLQSPDLTIWKITIDNSGIIQQETI